jgi:MmgE/PrpD N-terminal domain
MTWCEEAGRWAAGLTARNLPERVAARARLQQWAVLAAAAAGQEAAAPFANATPEGPLGEVWCGATASMAHDWDDYLYMGHTGHSAVWTARAFAPDDEERVLAAQVAGNELAGRLGAALFLGPHNGQFWSSIHCASAAAAAGVAFELDGERLAHALAIALYQPPYGLWPGFMGPDTKLLTAAEPAVQGARAARLAALGVKGPLGVVEDERGLLKHLSFAGRPAMLGGLGEVWLTDTLAFKPHPGCAYLQAAVDAALRADVPAAEVEAIDVEAGYLTVAMERLGAAGGLTPVGVGFSAARSIAVALLAGRLTHRELSPAWLSEHAEDVESLAARIHVRHDWEATLATLHGPVDAGASLRDVPASAWPRVLRRMRELGMAKAALSREDLRALVARRGLRRELLRLLRSGRPGGIAALDTSRMRMSFPSRLRIRLRSGRSLDLEGADQGACGAPLAEQRAVVETKAQVAGLVPEVSPAAR